MRRRRCVQCAAAEDKPRVQPMEEVDDSNPSLAGKFFGNYVQLGVWIVTLGFAGYTGMQKISEEPESVGMLLAPPLAAAFLISSFLVYRIVTSAIGGAEDKDA